MSLKNAIIARGGLAALVSVLLSTAAWAQAPSAEEMWRIIQEQARIIEQQGREIEALKQAQGAQAPAQAQTTAAQAAAQQAQAAAQQAQAAANQAQAAVATADTGTGAEGGWWERTSIGGYGELHYEGGSRDILDFHRFVLFFGHEFNDDVRFFSELEVEHALVGESRPGEVELEQAYIQLDLSEQHRLNAGIILLPLGILNEVHEPPTFFGVERNPIENNIIPTTWWEGGIGLAGNFGPSGFAYNVQVTSGLNVPVTGANAFRPRNGRQKVANAIARAPSVTGQVKYTGLPGVELAASGHYEFDMTQGAGDPLTDEDVTGFLFTTHADARYGGFGLRALYASWWIDSAAAELLGRDRQTGFYVEPSYRFAVANFGWGGMPSEFGVFYRYGWWDNNAGRDDLNLDTAQHTFGVNYWPHPNVAFKVDYQLEETGTGAEADRLNAGVGFQF
jgi:hypothetical protein